MINQESLDSLQQAQWISGFQRPLYRDYAFSCLPGTVSKLLTGTGDNPLAASVVGGSYRLYDCVVLFLIDGFGWTFFERFHRQLPALERFLNRGVASQISSQFPSTTAAHLTTLHTGQEVGQTGIYEWFQYEPLVDRMIAPILVSYAGEHEAGGLINEGCAPHQLFPFQTLYQKLARQGVRSYAFQQKKIAQSAYSQALLAGAESTSFDTFADALDLVRQHLESGLSHPSYLFVYFGDIDAIGHRHGTTGFEFEEAIKQCWHQVEERFWKKLGSLSKKVALLWTADHGMTAVNPKQTLFLNQLCPDLAHRIQVNRQGLPLIPAGSCRDFFLHVKKADLQRTLMDLKTLLAGKAEVLPTQELIDQGFFGSKPVSSRFIERVGNLVVLPYLGENVFWHFEKHRFEQHFYGAHGGLTSEELISQVLFVDLQ